MYLQIKKHAKQKNNISIVMTSFLFQKFERVFGIFIYNKLSTQQFSQYVFNNLNNFHIIWDFINSTVICKLKEHQN